MEAASSSLLEARADLQCLGKSLARSSGATRFSCDIRPGERSLWILAGPKSAGGIALRAAHSPDGALELVDARTENSIVTLELVAPLGRFRIRCELPTRARPLLHSTTWLTPTQPLTLPFWPRDLYAIDRKRNPAATHGTVHTAQRGPRTGLMFFSMDEPRAGTFLYCQNFGALSESLQVTHTSPADRVGGVWPELGYSPAPNPEHPLEGANEVAISDVFVAFDPQLPENDLDTAELFLDLLAEMYLALPRPNPSYHDWPSKAEQTVRDLSFSPKCTYRRQGRRYVTPYVADEEKPPESMVQFTVLLPMLEYERWSGKKFVLAKRLLEGLPSFYNDEISCLIRWLPGEKFGDTGEEGQKHENMDSWYLYHILFNLSRVAALGNKEALRLFRRSLPYAMRVAHRFDYRFPIFFDVNTLEVVRAESKPGAGGENDVAGLYSLTMLHAYELLGEPQYLQEAKKAATRLEHLGFKLGYQMNTTGFAGEATLRLFLQTGEQQYLRQSYVCLANVFENMWIWEANYGYAKDYTTFFGLFPLRDAPYLAPYEELEMLAKFHDYLKMGGEAIRPSVRLLMAEYSKYALDRLWCYYPANLPQAALAEKSRNGHLDRSLSVPVEDLQDGWEKSGQVGQEIYGAGVSLVYTTRHYKKLDTSGVLLFCNYPILNFKLRRGRCTFETGGDSRLNTDVRLIPTDPSTGVPPFTLLAPTKNGGKPQPHHGALSSEGHLVYEVAGGSAVEIRW